MKTSIVLLHLFIGASIVAGQSLRSVVDITTVYSQNEKFYLQSIPYDNEEPSLRGKTLVYEKGSVTPMYTFNRGFDSVKSDSNNLILSNDGELIFYLISWGADEKTNGLKSITIYQKGKIVRSFTESEITGCDKTRERCRLVYTNYDDVVDKEKSNWGTERYNKALKAGIDDKERFLSDFPIFSFDDTVYVTDPRKRVHMFDLKEGRYIGSDSFENLFEQIRNKGRFNKTEIVSIDAPVFSGFPSLKSGESAYQSLANILGLKPASFSVEEKPASISVEEDEQYKLYSFKINGDISRDGSLEIEDIEFYADLPKEKVFEFFKRNKFDSRLVPPVFDQWNLQDQYFYFRKPSARIARREKRQEIKEARREYARRLTLEAINGIYIPKTLGECFVELDKRLAEIDKEEMRTLLARDDMILYHLDLGMWMRNNWGLWAGSRLQQYFRARNIDDPEERTRS